MLKSAVLGPCVSQLQFAATPFFPMTCIVTSSKPSWGRVDAVDGNWRRLWTSVDASYPGCFGGGFAPVVLATVSQDTKRRVVRHGSRWACIEDCNARDGYHYERRVVSVHKTKRDAVAVYTATLVAARGGAK